MSRYARMNPENPLRVPSLPSEGDGVPEAWKGPRCAHGSALPCDLCAMGERTLAKNDEAANLQSRYLERQADVLLLLRDLCECSDKSVLHGIMLDAEALLAHIERNER